VVPPNILFSLHNAVNRKTKNGMVLGEEQRVPVSEALKAATIYAAYQIFEEENKGSITPGKLADFVILDQNPMKVSKEALKDIKVLRTMKEGEGIL
jgi:predicted amidohydrolase YtcJ